LFAVIFYRRLYWSVAQPEADIEVRGLMVCSFDMERIALAVTCCQPRQSALQAERYDTYPAL